MKKLIERSKIIDDILYNLILCKLYKSYLLLISDQKEMGIGDVSLGNPSTIRGFKSNSTSYSLFGIKNKMLSRILAERSSITLKAPVLLLLFIKSKKKEEEITKPLVRFLNECLSEINSGFSK